jgi:diacylglycerol kinase family enzyme
MSNDATSDTPPKRIAVVVNPTKFDDLQAVRQGIAKECADAGWAEPMWIETTVEDPGVGQGQEAVDAGVDIVCPLGGDGTVRSVATALVGTQTPLGLLPGGTGNLLARNLDLPVDQISDALAVVLTGRNRTIDVGLVTMVPHSTSADAVKGEDPATEDDPRRDDEEVFLVMTGIGVDAEVMANTNEKVKGVLGWPAYVLAGVGRIWSRGFRIRLSSHGGRPRVHPRARHARSVLFANCGTLQGNFRLIPDAKVDDGLIDAVVMSPKGVFGWVGVGADLASRHRRGHPQVMRFTGTTLAVRTERAVEAQIDGDPMGEQYGLAARVLPGALLVRVGA